MLGLMTIPLAAQADSPRAFLDKALKGDNSEIMLGRLAADHAGSQAVRDFGNTLVRDHTQARNQVLVLSADAVVAIGGGWGTLSEIALALKFRIPVVTLRSWSLRRPDGLNDPLLAHAVTAPDAVALALRAAERRRAGEPRGEATVE